MDRGVHRRGPYAACRLILWMIDRWDEWDGWCTTRGLDAIALPADRAVNAYLSALRENADEKELARLEAALTPPARGGVPSWWESDEAAAAEWLAQR